MGKLLTSSVPIKNVLPGIQTMPGKAFLPTWPAEASGFEPVASEFAIVPTETRRIEAIPRIVHSSQVNGTRSRTVALEPPERDLCLFIRKKCSW